MRYFAKFILFNDIMIKVLYMLLEYNIIFPTTEKTGRRPCCIREQIIGIEMVSEHDFDNVTCIWSCDVYVL